MAIPAATFRLVLKGGLCLLAGLATLSLSAQGIQPVEPTARTTDSTAAKIIALHLQARGGLPALRELQSLRLTGIVEEGNERHEVVWSRQSPDKLRVQRSREHLGWTYEDLSGTDGQQVWKQVLQPEKGPPLEMSEPEAKLFALEADFWGPLVDADRKGHVFTYEGPANVAERPAYLVKGYLAGGAEVYYYFDQQTFHILNYGAQESFGGRTVNVDRLPLGLRNFGGVWLETGYEYRTGGQRYRRVEFTKIEPNVALAPELFTMPPRREIRLGSR